MSVKMIESEEWVGAAPAEALALWANEPLLMRRRTGYRGRVVAEVWHDGAVRVVTGSGTSIKQVLAALSDESATVESVDGLPESPITGSRGEAEFLGRVMVEFWHDRVRIGVTGSRVALIREQAVKELRQLASSV